MRKKLDEIRKKIRDEEISQRKENIRENLIKINKNKSGIVVIHNQQVSRTEIRGYPVCKDYKYLGLVLNKEVNPKESIEKAVTKLNTYITRNEWLIKEFFSPKSLIQLTQYFQISRLTYGMNVYLDHSKIIDLVQKATQKFIRSALGLKFNASSARTRLALGLSKL